MARKLSLIKPTGRAHLGNYIGALRHWVADQSEDTFYGLADLHALTVPQDPRQLRSVCLELAQTLMAIGLDPDRCTLFAQSHIHEHTELAWLMECTVSIGELRRMTQFKDKSAKGGEEAARAGLFTYPALMAADILLYDATEVPVGEDQRQHLELTRDLATRFNTKYGRTFVLPKAATPKAGARVMDLQDPGSKMGKTSDSGAGTIYLLDSPDEIVKKIKRAVTDAGTDVVYDPERRPGVSNLLTILGAMTDEDPHSVASRYTQYGPLKSDTADAVVAHLADIQERYRALAADEGGTLALLAEGDEKARSVASATMARARSAVGLLPFS